MRKGTILVFAIGLGILWTGESNVASGQLHPSQNSQYYRFHYYPYYYFPHNYWPAQSPPWPEPLGAPYMRPPAYMSYPPFHEPRWRYELWQPQRFYRGFHFWLDQF